MGTFYLLEFQGSGTWGTEGFWEGRWRCYNNGRQVRLFLVPSLISHFLTTPTQLDTPVTSRSPSFQFTQPKPLQYILTPPSHPIPPQHSHSTLPHSDCPTTPQPNPPSHLIPSHPGPLWVSLSHFTLSYPSQFPEHSISHPLNPTSNHHISLSLIPFHSTTHPSPSQFFRSIPSQHIPVYSWSYHNSLLPTLPQSISNPPVSSVPPPWYSIPSTPFPSPAWPKFSFLNAHRVWPFFMSHETTWEKPKDPGDLKVECILG